MVSRDRYTVKFVFDKAWKPKKIVVINHIGSVVGRRPFGFVGKKEKRFVFDIPKYGDRLTVGIKRDRLRGQLLLCYYEVDEMDGGL